MKTIALALLFAGSTAGAAYAHHSLAMYDTDKTYVFTGVVTGVNPSAAHLAVHFVPLNDARTKVIKDADGEPVEWSVEMGGAAQSARDGITVNGFPRGTIISVGLHPLRNGGHAGARGNSGFFKCPPNTPPAPGKFCDSVEGTTIHGFGELPDAADETP